MENNENGVALFRISKDYSIKNKSKDTKDMKIYDLNKIVLKIKESLDQTDMDTLDNNHLESLKENISSFY